MTNKTVILMYYLMSLGCMTIFLIDCTSEDSLDIESYLFLFLSIVSFVLALVHRIIDRHNDSII